MPPGAQKSHFGPKALFAAPDRFGSAPVWLGSGPVWVGSGPVWLGSGATFEPSVQKVICQAPMPITVGADSVLNKICFQIPALW